MSNVLKFPENDITYIEDCSGKIRGVQGDSVEMVIMLGKYYFNKHPISREDLLAFFLLTGLLDEIEAGAKDE